MKILKEIEKKQRGFTLIEFMVVIALIGLGLVLVVTQFGQANEANRTSTAIKNITSLAGGVSSFKGTRTGYTGLSASGLLATNAVPDNMLGTANQITNVFGGAVTLAAATDTNQYTMTYATVPVGSCVEIASRVNSSFVSVTVTGGTTGTAGQITSLSIANTECNAPGTATVSMVFTGS